MDTLWKTRNRGMPHLGRYSDADVLTQNTTFIMRILKRLTDILPLRWAKVFTEQADRLLTEVLECMGLKLDMLTLYFRSRVRSKCQTREVDGMMGFLTEHVWAVLFSNPLGKVNTVYKPPIKFITSFCLLESVKI